MLFVMDTGREKAYSSEGGASIRLRYSTQLQINGRTHAIDAEIVMPVGASAELREQLIREADLSVDQLARQISRRNSGGTRTPENGRPSTPAPAPQRLTSEQPALARQATNPALPAVRAPVGESMPATPASGGEGRTIKLADFINAIHKHMNLSPKEAIELLKIKNLEGLNFYEAYWQLEELVRRRDGRGVQEGMPPARSVQPQPVPEVVVPSRLPVLPENVMDNAPGATRSPRPAAASISLTRSTAGEAMTRVIRSEPGPERDPASPSKAPVPIRLGNPPLEEPARTAFAEEDEDEELDFDDFEGEDEEDEEDEDYAFPVDKAQERTNAQFKLDRLRGIRGTQAASAERLKVLDTVVDAQISDDQLQQIIQGAWGSTKKKLKNKQVEELISWAKEDFFVEEAEALLKLLEKGAE